MGAIFSNYVNSCYHYWMANNNSFVKITNSALSGKVAGFEVAVFNNPANGTIQGGYNGGYEAPNGLVVLGFNPSGAHTTSRARKIVGVIPGQSNSFYIWDSFSMMTQMDPYTKAVEDFAVNCGYGENHYKLDAFGILQFTQKNIEDAIYNQPFMFCPLFGLSISTIIQLRPKVIVFVNAGLRRIIIDHNLFRCFIPILNWDRNKCAYEICITNGVNRHKCYALFTTILSGGHLDKGSRECLAQVVRNI